jgi:ABC transport system ATP-binding/permease protein
MRQETKVTPTPAVFTLDQVSFRYSDRELFGNVTLTISEREKVGIVGGNGAGKSTMLRMLAGLETPDSGIVSRKNGIFVAYLPQDPPISPDATLMEQVLKGYSAMTSGKREAAEYQAKTILTRLGFSDFDKRTGNLSGGEKKRVALAAALLDPSEVLLLDEPTNHIDSGMVDWLEEYLQAYKGTLLLVTHDRYFLDRVCGRIIEISSGHVINYCTNYSGYLERKAAMEEMDAATVRKQKSLFKKELAWIRRGARARSTKAKGRVQQFDLLKTDIESSEGFRSPLEMTSLSSRLGKKILSVEHLYKSYAGKTVVRDFSYMLLRDDRIGIIGPNGCGKTTLLRLLSGEILPDSGMLEKGDTVRIGYFAQHCPAFDPQKRVIDAVRDIAEIVHMPDGDVSASKMLERFLFVSGDQYQQIFRLSGGEKRRLYLLQILMQAPNVLLLDEPTNDFDIDTLTVLEDYLEAFQGAVIAVSHDRYFLDKVAYRLFSFENDGIYPYQGGYDAYRQARAAKDAPVPAEPLAQPKEPCPRLRERREPVRMTFREQQDYETIEGTISELEQKIESLAVSLEASASDYIKLMALAKEKEETEALLENAMSRWVYLHDLRDAVEQIHKP